ncbi:MAG: AraC family transcriptional regulator [Spirulina sp. SIO3F2]|nr:AraC family transcriptional regulator [Spirulina sp. SIO3F2]
MTPSVPTILAAIAVLRLQIARNCGVDTDLVLQRVGLTEAHLKRPLARITIEQDWAILRELVAVSGDPTLGLKLGQRHMAASFGILGYIIMNCPTIASALRMISRYERLVTDVQRTAVEDTDAGLVFVLSYENWPDCPEERYVSDYVMASVAKVIQTRAGEPSETVLRAVHFHYQRPTDLENLDIYWKTFGHVALRFGCPDTRCLLSRRVLTMPLMGSNPDLLKVFEAQGQALLAQYDQENWRDRVRQSIIHALQTELPTLDEIATELTLSSRSLQLKLQAEQTSFKTVLDEVRRDLAMELLRKRQLNKTEIACLLGFSSVSTFSRTFKRWTGKSPSAFQKSVLL